MHAFMIVLVVTATDYPIFDLQRVALVGWVGDADCRGFGRGAGV